MLEKLSLIVKEGKTFDVGDGKEKGWAKVYQIDGKLI